MSGDRVDIGGEAVVRLGEEPPRFLGIDLSSDPGRHQPQERSVGGERFEATSVSAAAEATFGIDDDMANLTGHAAPALHQGAAADHAEPEAGGHVEQGEVVAPHRGARGPLAQAECRRRLKEPTRHVDSRLQVMGRGMAIENVEIRAGSHAVLLRGDQRVDHNTNPMGGAGGVGEHLPALRLDRCEQRGIAIGRGKPTSVTVGDPPIHARYHNRAPAHVDEHAHDDGGGRGHPHQLAGPPQRRLLRIHFLEQSPLEQGIDRLRHGRSGEPGPPAEHRPRGRPIHLEVFEQSSLVDFPQQRRLDPDRPRCHGKVRSTGDF